MFAKTVVKALAAGGFALAFSGAVPALPQPGGDPILTVSGAIAEGKPVELDRAMLEQLGSTTVETTTPWFNGVSRFEGVRLDKLMEAVGAKGTRVAAVALNDYVSEIPIEDFSAYGVILAYKRDGAYMAVREKGPLFVIYPFDAHPDTKAQKYYSRSVWQVKSLIVK